MKPRYEIPKVSWRRKTTLLAITLILAACADREVAAYGLSDAARETGFSPKLIRAIALEESRRIDPVDGVVRPWPWTLRAGDQGMFFETRRDAEKKLRELRYQGVTNIDVGAMQVNTRWNGHLAARPEDLLDPAVNLWAFTQVIRECQSRMSRVEQVIACYHTGRPNTERGRAYARRVLDRYRQMEKHT